VHPPAWLTVTLLAAIVTVPVRAGPVLAAIASCAVPFPAPLAPLVIEIQDALLVDVQEHSVAVLIWTFCEPPAAGAAIVSGETVAVQPAS
jgi:hypothetical protein